MRDRARIDAELVRAAQPGEAWVRVQPTGVRVSSALTHVSPGVLALAWTHPLR